ncbi:YitT family protein [Clostridium aciditolerans]|uniref:YitT family protein n=1 Tax=Clostridium aciditolerans TaxID=339861 RepID=A0A934M5K3_9CLOT|nr:YitT family protein [Clostridium aciditolerans]MBI6873688.1 YitT family protein [Clostridium aciditolerans]
MNMQTITNNLRIKDVAFIVLGCLLSSIGLNMFIVHAKLYSGGVSGLAILIQYITKFPAGYTIMLANIPLLVISFKKLNIRFTIYSLIGTVCYSVFLVITKDLQTIISTNDTLLYCLYGGLLNGLGIGLTYANHGSMGGINIITMLFKKKHDNYDVGKIGLIFNCLIVCIATLLNGILTALYTLISMYITAVVTDKIIHGMVRKKLLFIITEKEKEVCDYIITYMHRGATILNGQTLTGKERKVLYCIVHLSHLPELKYSIQNIDKDALISVIDASEVDGKGFDSSIL